MCLAYYSLSVCVCSSVAVDDLCVSNSINKCNMSPCVCVCVCVCLSTGHFCSTITGTVWCYTVWLISAINATVRIINVVILLLDKKDLLSIRHCLVCYITFSVNNGMVVHRRYLFRHYENRPPTRGSPDQSRPPPM